MLSCPDMRLRLCLVCPVSFSVFHLFFLSLVPLSADSGYTPPSDGVLPGWAALVVHQELTPSQRYHLSPCSISLPLSLSITLPRLLSLFYLSLRLALSLSVITHFAFPISTLTIWLSVNTNSHPVCFHFLIALFDVCLLHHTWPSLYCLYNINNMQRCICTLFKVWADSMNTSNSRNQWNICMLSETAHICWEGKMVTCLNCYWSSQVCQWGCHVWIKYKKK